MPNRARNWLVRCEWLANPTARAMSASVYVAVMTRWRPRRAWFAEHCGKLSAIAAALDGDPRLAALWAANFS